MATQGLFTQGPSVEDLLAKRNKRSFDLQQTLMQQAAQGARDPAKAQAISLLGSTLGRAIAGSMGGGKDAEVEKIQAQEAAQKTAQQAYMDGVSSNTSAGALQAARILQDKFPVEATQLIQVAQKLKKQEEAQTSLTTEAKRVAERLPRLHPMRQVLESANVTQDDITAAREILVSNYDEGVASDRAKNKEFNENFYRKRKGNAYAQHFDKNDPMYSILTSDKVTQDELDKGLAAIEEMNKKEEKDDIRTSYDAQTPEGEIVRIGEDKSGKTWLLTKNGRQPAPDSFKPLDKQEKIVHEESDRSLILDSHGKLLNSNPYSKYVETVSTVSTAKSLVERVKQGDAQAQAALWRDVVNLHDGGTRAVQEIVAQRTAGTLTSKPVDLLNSATYGSLSNETLNDISNLIAVAERDNNAALAQRVNAVYNGLSTVITPENQVLLQSNMLSVFPENLIHRGKVTQEVLDDLASQGPRKIISTEAPPELRGKTVMNVAGKLIILN